MCGHPEHFLNIGRKRRGEPTIPTKQVFFYPLVVKLNNNLLPLITSITDDQTARNIAYFLKEFKESCIKESVKWPIVKKTMVDFSSALFIAINYAWNDLEGTKQYLKKMFELMENDLDVDDKFVVLHGCCAHFAKIVSNDLDRFSKNKRVKISKFTKHLIQESMALATTLNNYESMWSWWTNFVLIFGSKHYTKHVQTALVEMRCLIEKNDEIVNDAHDADVNEIDVSLEEKSIYKSSPFYKKAMQTIETEQSRCNKITNKRNVNYVKGILEHYAKKYMFNLPFWTNYFGFKIDSTRERDSNQSAEAFFFLSKILQAGNEKGLRPTQVIQILKEICEGGLVKTSINELGILASSKVITRKLNEIDTPTSSTTRIKTKDLTRTSYDQTTPKSTKRYRDPEPKKDSSEDELNPEDELNLEEPWRPKKKKPNKEFSYYNGNNFHRLVQSIEGEQIKGNCKVSIFFMKEDLTYCLHLQELDKQKKNKKK